MVGGIRGAKNRTGDRSRHRRRARGHVGADAGRLCGRARRTAQGQAGRGRQGRRADGPDARRADRRRRSGLDQGAVRQDQGDIRPARPAVQQCRHRRAGDADRRDSVRQMAGRGRHQSHRPVPVHAGSHQDHEGAEPARRPHHQQRLDLRAHAAAGLGRLHGDQARRHRAHQADRARLPRRTTSAAARSTSAMPRRR